MKKKILITGGPTNEYIDEVMKITNMSTGRLSVELTKYFAYAGYDVTLICCRSVARGGLYERYKIANMPGVKTVQIETTEDMQNALIEASKEGGYDLIIHCAAVGDYKPSFTFRMEDMAKEIADRIENGAKPDAETILSIMTDPKCKVNDDTKISSYEPNLTVKLTLTPKLISMLRERFPGAKIVGFKLLENVTREHLIEVAQKLCIRNGTDYIIANDLHDLRENRHISYLVNKDGYCDCDFHAPYDIFEKTRSLIDSDCC